MVQHNFFISKTTGTYSDALEAFGLCSLLNKLFRDKDVTITNHGSYYEIGINVELFPSMESFDYFQIMPYIKTKEDDCKIRPFIDYEEQKKIKQEYGQFKKERWTDFQKQIYSRSSSTERKQIWKKYRKALSNYEPKPHQNYDIFSTMMSLKALNAYKTVFNNIPTNKKHFGEFMDTLFNYYADRPKQLSDIEYTEIKRQLKALKATEIKAVQFFSPHQGKGLNAQKCNSSAVGPMSSFWLKDCLKMVGCYDGMYCRKIKIGKQFDTKIYVLDPKEIEFIKHKKLFGDFKRHLDGMSSIRLDINSVLAFCIDFIKNSEEYKSAAPAFSKLLKPKNFINGFYCVYFKSLGHSSAVANMSYLELPNFISVDGYETGKLWIKILEEHKKRIKALQENAGGLCVSLLQNYRQFITTGELRHFFDFIAEYAEFLMQQTAKKKKDIKPFSLNLIEELVIMVDENFKVIFQSNGFKNIATAIRSSTISAQYNKAKGAGLYEVFYGMAQELIRKAEHKDELAEYLSEFVVRYNAETARVAERHPDLLNLGKIRPTVKKEDIEDVVDLIDKYGPTIVGKLLCACGYSLLREREELSATE